MWAFAMHASRSFSGSILVLCFLTAVAILSIMGKLMTLPPTADAREELASNNFTGLGLVMLDRRALSRDGVYTLTRFARPPCNGVLNVVKLQRNAEGAGLLAQAVPNARVRFVLDGTTYETFPTMRYWVARLSFAIGTSIGRQYAPPVLAAYSELGDCSLLPKGS